jgi:hypothetical protein
MCCASLFPYAGTNLIRCAVNNLLREQIASAGYYLSPHKKRGTPYGLRQKYKNLRKQIVNRRKAAKHAKKMRKEFKRENED